jgi:hypothetical protein
MFDLIAILSIIVSLAAIALSIASLRLNKKINALSKQKGEK